MPKKCGLSRKARVSAKRWAPIIWKKLYWKELFCIVRSYKQQGWYSLNFPSLDSKRVDFCFQHHYLKKYSLDNCFLHLAVDCLESCFLATPKLFHELENTSEFSLAKFHSQSTNFSYTSAFSARFPRVYRRDDYKFIQWYRTNSFNLWNETLNFYDAASLKLRYYVIRD